MKLACNVVSVAGMSAACSDCGSIGGRATETYFRPARHRNSLLHRAGESRATCPRGEKAAKLMSWNTRRSAKKGEQQVPATAVFSFAVVLGRCQRGSVAHRSLQAKTMGCGRTWQLKNGQRPRCACILTTRHTRLLLALLQPHMVCTVTDWHRVLAGADGR